MPKKKLPQVVSGRVVTFVSNTAWGDFVDWCLRKNLNPMPAHAWTLASYILSLEGQLNPTQIRKCLTEVAKEHTKKSKKRPDRDPLIEKTIKIIEQRNDQKSNRAKTLDDEDFSDPTAPKVKKTSLKKKAPGNKTKKPPRRAMRRAPKLVMKRCLN
jgi:hypothetical protein